jgi:hypothetical protein
MEGVGCSPEMIERCRVFRVEGRCYEDTHHGYWPERDYKSDVEKEFVRLAINQTVMCRALHQEEHVKPPPVKPTRDQMLEVINGNRT